MDHGEQDLHFQDGTLKGLIYNNIGDWEILNKAGEEYDPLEGQSSSVGFGGFDVSDSESLADSSNSDIQKQETQMTQTLKGESDSDDDNKSDEDALSCPVLLDNKMLTNDKPADEDEPEIKQDIDDDEDGIERAETRTLDRTRTKVDLVDAAELKRKKKARKKEVEAKAVEIKKTYMRRKLGIYAEVGPIGNPSVDPVLEEIEGMTLEKLFEKSEKVDDTVEDIKQCVMSLLNFTPAQFEKHFGLD